jgi:uncharacterized membrane protein YfcA
MLAIGIIYLLTGVGSGLLAGLLGVGGGIIIVPILYAIFAHVFDGNLSMHMAIGTSLGFMMFNGPYAVYQHHKQCNVDWQDFKRFSPGALLGSFCGAMLADSLEGGVLKSFFGLFCFFSAGLLLQKLIFGSEHHTSAPSHQKPYKDRLFSVLVGFVSAIVGIGGSTLMVPYLLWRGRQMRVAVGTAASLTPVISGLGAIIYILAGLDRKGLPAGSLGYVSLIALVSLLIGGLPGSYVGARLAKRFPAKVLKGIFIVVLLITAYKMFH